MTLQKRALDLMDLSTDLVELIDNRAWEAALSHYGRVMSTTILVAQELAQEAFNEGITKKAIAEAMGVDARTFRGMEKTR